jgi:hypothetical protein
VAPVDGPGERGRKDARVHRGVQGRAATGGWREAVEQLEGQLALVGEDPLGVELGAEEGRGWRPPRTVGAVGRTGPTSCAVVARAVGLADAGNRLEGRTPGAITSRWTSSSSPRFQLRWGRSAGVNKAEPAPTWASSSPRTRPISPPRTVVGLVGRVDVQRRP